MQPVKRLARLLGGAGVALGALVAIPSTIGPAMRADLYVASPAALVNPFIGTENGGDTFPGADVPFGMIQWSPDTTSRPDGGGYYYGDTKISGYSLTHLSGPGCSADGDVPILPTVGPIGTRPGKATEPLDHSLEVAHPGYYQLTAGGIETQLSTTLRAGIAKFTFPKTTKANLLFQLAESETPDTATDFQVVSNHEISGYISSGYFCGESNTYTLHFDVVFNRPFVTHGGWINGTNVEPGASKISSHDSKELVKAELRSMKTTSSVSANVLNRSKASTRPEGTGKDGAYLTFDTTSDPVVVAKVGISYVSTQNAALNRETEIPGWNLKTVQAAATDEWNAALGKIAITGGSNSEESVFYTALYHSLLHPNVESDVNGQYMGGDGKVHHLISGQQAEYANYSGWDIYRSEIQLEAMLFPKQTSDIVTSMLETYSATGMLPKWSENNGESYIMVGDPADSIIADAYAFGARDFDARTALSDMVHEATVSGDIRPGLSYFESLGYLPSNGNYGCCNYYGPVSTQEEYDVADNSIALLASELGEKRVATAFAMDAQNWQDLYDPNTGFLQPKLLDGAFKAHFTATSENGFVEADSYIYTAELPFDLKGLVETEGGEQQWVDYLDSLTASVTGMGSNQIQMGDEPSFDIPWEYDYAGEPYMTQQVVREIQDQLFSDAPNGLPGNDDLGAMSSWLVWSEIGGYPEMPGNSQIAVGSPLFTSIRVDLGDGKSIVEKAPGAGTNAPYSQSVSLDGASWNDAYLPGSLFSNGGTIDWNMSTTPNTSWAATPGEAPESNTTALSSAIGYVQGKKEPGVTIAPGSDIAIAIGVQNTEKVTQDVNWQATSTTGSGITVTPAAGNTIAVPAEAKRTERVWIEVPKTTPEGRYLVTFQFTGNLGTNAPPVVEQVSVGATP